ncbi:LLM class flavin-dependent oxidoreductase [Enteractinococcus helveticum]|uniref:LLM class flavin-dependent oxidoreductase n=1 Tax=Enteractinococcus helveticum TaxID=1837282 RepID=UPI0005BCF1CB|nr:LLM class flavin-dependent oxidoreductase [Enteractinococcus helveticum]
MQKKLGFLNFGHFGYDRATRTVDPKAALDDQLAMTVAAEEEGLDGAWIRVHHFQWMMSAPFPTLAAMAAKTSTIELGTGVIDLRYENPLYFAEESATTDLIAGGRLQLGISRGSPEAALDGQAQFGYTLEPGQTWGELAQHRGQRIRDAVGGKTVATGDPNSPWSPGGATALVVQPQAAGLINRLWWGSGSTSSGITAGKQGYNLLSSTLLLQDDGRPFHVQQADQIKHYLDSYQGSGFETGGQTAVTRSMYALRSVQDERMFGHAGSTQDQAGRLEGGPARSGPTYVGHVEQLAEMLSNDQAVMEADYVLFANPAQLGPERNREIFAGWVEVFKLLGWK